MTKDERAARYAPPNKLERAQRMADLIATPAMPLSEVALFLDLPASTIETLHREGRGPRCFKIGKRFYVTQANFRAWIDALSLDPDPWKPMRRYRKKDASNTK